MTVSASVTSRVQCAIDCIRDLLVRRDRKVAHHAGSRGRHILSRLVDVCNGIVRRVRRDLETEDEEDEGDDGVCEPGEREGGSDVVD